MWGKSGVYLIRCIHTEDTYIGSTRCSLRIRINYHKNQLRKNAHHIKRLQELYNQYGEDGLEYTVLMVTAPQHARRHEQQLIEERKPTLNTYKVRGIRYSPKAAKLGIKPTTYYARALRGLKGDALLAAPYGNHRRYSINGEMLTAQEIARLYRLPLKLVRQRLYKRTSTKTLTKRPAKK